MRHAVILAGGSGTRLWPASRREQPKQFLSLVNDEPLIQAAIRLGRELTHAVLVVTAESQERVTRRHVSTSTNILTEPMGRNTAAAIGLAAATIARRDPHAVMIVLPADQHIRDTHGMARMLDTACSAVEATDVIATIGIVPTRPETGFGYLQVDGEATPGILTEVLSFVEKPDAATAEGFVKSGRYLWNAGIFCMSARRLLTELDRHLPETGQAVREIADDSSDAAALYAALPSISIDHAVMEHARGVVTVPASVGWDDVGSWAALPNMLGADENKNTIAGNAVVVDGSGNVVISDDGSVVAVVGVSDMVIVKNGDAILVIPKDRAQDVRKVVEALAARGLDRYL